MHDIICRVAAHKDVSWTAGMRRSSRLALAAIGFGLLPALAAAQPYYPRIVESGENSTIDYGPGPLGNIVGGGRVVVTGSGEDTTLTHLDPQLAQRPRVGMVPVAVGSGEDFTTVWVPAATDWLQMALIGGDGSLLETTSPGTPIRTASRRIEPSRE